MKLYKYATPDRLDILQNKTIRFTQPHLFNDPFEISDTVASLEDFDADQPLVRALLETPVGQTLFEMFDHGLSQGLKQYFSYQYGVLSLAGKADNLLMWAHYAKNHRGFVIEFDGEHPFFNRRKSDADRFRYPWKVAYSANRPASSLKKYNAVEALLMKSVDWEYEQEWRMIVPVDEATKKIETDAEEVHLFAVPASCITAVILGCRMLASDKGQITELLAADDEYRHVIVRQADLDDKAFRLNLTESPLLHAQRATNATSAGDSTSAIEYANLALECAADTDKGRYYALRGYIYGRSGDNDRYLSDMQRFKELDEKGYWKMLGLDPTEEGADAGSDDPADDT